MKKVILIIVMYCVLLCAAYAQTSISTPTIKNFTPADYSASNEIWDIKQDKNGILYFANNDGLLTFDGSYWKTYTLPNKTGIKSVAIDASGKIFVGGQDEIGYFFPDDKGVLKFHSIRMLLPKKAQQFADIWNIVFYRNEVFFRTVECIFEYKNNSLKTFDAPGGWVMLTATGGQLFANDRDLGLVTFKNNGWEPCCGKTPTANLRITGVLDYKKDTLLVTTLKKGLYSLTSQALIKKPTAVDGLLFNDLIKSTKKLGDNRYAIATTANGLLIINGAGSLIERFSTGEGLHSNNVLALLPDRDKNLWAGLENGLDFINYNTSVKHIYPSNENLVKSNTIRIFAGKLFIGTSNGLYSVPVSPQQTDLSTAKGTFTEVANTKGPVWSLTESSHHLLIGHHDGALLLQDNQAKPITAVQGVWTFLPIPASPDVIAGSYTGLQKLTYTGGGFKDAGKIGGIYESLSNLAWDNHIIWASHPFRGIYKIRLSPDKKKVIDYKQYTGKDGLPSVLNNRVYNIRHKILIATEKGIYEYHATTDKFMASPAFRPIFGEDAVEYLTEDTQRNIWFVSNQRVGLVDFKPADHKPYHITYFPELTGQTVKGSEFIYPYNNQNIFIGSNSGVFHLNYQQYIKSETQLNVLLTTVKAIAEKDSLIFGGYFIKNNQVSALSGDNQEVTSLSNHWNSFHFEYSSTLFAQKSNEEFSYKLIGFDNDWSGWSTKTEKDYTNLPYGKYTFSVRARNNLGNASQPVNYNFVVQPAWYQTIWAYLFYLLLIAGIIYLALKELQKRFDLHQQRHEEEQRRLTYLHSLELDRNEIEIIALKNDKLEAELLYKNKELASITMNLVERGRLLLNIKEELMSLIKKLNITDPAYQFRSVFKLLSDTEKNGDDWDQFSIYFDQVHNNFLLALKTRFPTLSSTDLKLCAYLRLNLSSKEIAQLLNISLKGVEISRYRLRKKLMLTTETNLYDFLIEITSVS